MTLDNQREVSHAPDSHSGRRGLLGSLRGGFRHPRHLNDSAGAPRRVPTFPTLAEAYRARTARLVAACTIDRSYDQPWLANRSADLRRVYIDRRVPRILKCGIDTDKTLPVHEISEALAMNDGLRYDESSPGKGPTAHNDVATPLEREAVEAQRSDDPDIWKKYTEELDGYIREVNDETITRVAPDQDLRQFAEDDRELLRRIIAAEKRDPAGLHHDMSDAGTGRLRDPTGTGTIRSKFRRDLDSRWLQLRRLTISAFAPQHDILGLRTAAMVPSATAIDPSMHRLPGSDRVVAFRNWLEERQRQLILAGDVGSYINAAVRLANKRAEALTGTKGTASPHERIEHMTSLAKSELAGITAAVTQRATRALAHGLAARQRPDKIAREIAAVVDSVGKTRGRMLVNYVVVKAFNGVSLDAFRAAGISHVGIVPEKLRAVRGPHGKHLVKDARRSIDLSEVDVLTAGDELVCQTCQDISDDGPYDLATAEGLLPVHPNCRCAVIPAYDLRFAPVRDAGPPDEERDERGRWTEGGSGFLYHGTSSNLLESIKQKGLIDPENTDKQSVMFHSNEETAKSYAKGASNPKIYGGSPVLLRVHSKNVHINRSYEMAHEGGHVLNVRGPINTRHIEVNHQGTWKSLQ
jgi:hypothetical protein